MAFRVSDATLFHNAVRSTRLNRFALSEMQNKLSSGKAINSVADDPIGATQILGLRRTIARVDQFQRNIEGARSALQPIEGALQSLTDILGRLRELAVSADIETGQFDLIKPEVEQLWNEVLRISSTKVGERYLFGGYNTDQTPFSQVGNFTEGTVSTSAPDSQYNGDNGVLSIQIGESTTVNASVTGREIFFGSSSGTDTPDSGNVDIFSVIRDLRNRLEDPTSAGNPTDVTGNLDSALNQVLKVRAKVGATLNRTDIASVQYTDLKVTLETERSSVEDLDFIAAATKLANLENTFQASLAVTGRIIQPSLLNFLG